MSNDQQGCCIIEVCCGEEYPDPPTPASSPKQITALAAAISMNSHINPQDALKAATYLCNRFDFAPKGSLKQLKDYVRKETLLHPVYNSGD